MSLGLCRAIHQHPSDHLFLIYDLCVLAASVLGFNEDTLEANFFFACLDNGVDKERSIDKIHFGK